MDERFEIFQFWSPIPKADRNMDWPQCGRCGAEFFLTGAAPSSPDAVHVGGPALPLQGVPHVPPHGPGSLATELEKLAQMHSTGLLDASEFKAAKHRLLHVTV